MDGGLTILAGMLLLSYCDILSNIHHFLLIVMKNADLSSLSILAVSWEVRCRGKTVNTGLTFEAAYQLACDTIMANRSHRFCEGHGKCYALIVSSDLPLFSTEAKIYCELIYNRSAWLTSISIL